MYGGGEGGCEMQGVHIHRSPDVHDDVRIVCFSFQVLYAASSVPQVDTIHLTQHSSLCFPRLKNSILYVLFIQNPIFMRCWDTL